MLGGEWFVLAPVKGPQIPAAGGVGLARAVRAALLHHAVDPSPELISGHAPGPVGAPTPASDRAHLAVVPLPFVGHPHADGHVVGIALVLPRDTSRDERRALLAALGRWRGDDHRFVLTMGRAGRYELVLTDELEHRTTLQRARWCRASSTWATVTPMALDRFPGDLSGRDPARTAKAVTEAEKLIRRACTHVGLPVPWKIIVSRQPLINGVSPVRGFPPYRVADGGALRLGVHVQLTFPSAVSGPLLLGAGRYLGRGLFLPFAAEAGDG